MTEEERKLLSGQLFWPGDESLRALKLKAHKLNLDYNRLYEDETAQREAILKDLLGGLGEGSFLQGPITFHYGCHTTIGDDCFINFNFTVQDDALVTIGDHCDIGPNVTIVTPLHPYLPEERQMLRAPDGTVRDLCWAKPVQIGSGCWIGANAVICPGVTVGEGCIIGAGSVVTRSVPPRSVVSGNPAAVVRTLTERDSIVNFPDIAESWRPVSGTDE